MEMLDRATHNSVKLARQLISNNLRQLICLINCVILCGVISLFGSVANVINMVVFYRQGLDTTINISFFSLAVSDLCGLVFQQVSNVYMNPLFVDMNLPIAYLEFQHLTAGLPREMFARITCLITAFITAERCLCVAFPLHIKRIITPRKSAFIVIVIFTFTLLSPVPVYFTSYYTWKFYPDSNTTLLGLAFTKHHDITEACVYLTHALFTFVGFLSCLTFTLILVYKLGQKSAWRQAANVDQEKAKSMSKRDRATIKMVVLIAGILVVAYTPAVLLGLTTFAEPEFSVNGRYTNLYYSLWSFAFVFENLNSSVNILLHYKMSTKYRQAFRALFSRGLHSVTSHLSKTELTEHGQK